jgi:hypothetical protein
LNALKEYMGKLENEFKNASLANLEEKPDKEGPVLPREDRREKQLDYGDEKPRFREKWWQIW